MRIEYEVENKKHYLEVEFRFGEKNSGIGIHMDNHDMLKLCYDYDINVLTDLSEKLKEIYEIERKNKKGNIEFEQKSKDMAMEIAAHMDLFILGNSIKIFDGIDPIKSKKEHMVERARIADIGANFELDKNSKSTHLIYKTLRGQEKYVSSSVVRLTTSEDAASYYTNRKDKIEKTSLKKLKPIGVKYKLEFGSSVIKDNKVRDTGIVR